MKKNLFNIHSKLINVIFFLIRRFQVKTLRFIRYYKVIHSVKNYELPFYIGGPVSFNSRTSIGKYSSFNGLTVKGFGEVDIGDYCHFGADVLIITSNHNYDFGKKLPYDESEINKNVIINRAVWIGDRVTILGGTEIGEGAIIQAAAVVTESVPAFAIAGGNPARVFKYRDINHYHDLAGKGHFLEW